MPPLEREPYDELTALFVRSYATVHYARSHERVSSDNRSLLSLGNSWETLLLAAANPGARIVAADVDPLRIKQSERRLRYHGFWQGEYQILTDLRLIKERFDFIDTTDLLSWIPNPGAALATWRSLLKPDGILKISVHNTYGAQTLLNLRQSLAALNLANLPRAQACHHIRSLGTKLTPKPFLPSDDLSLSQLYLRPGLQTYTVPQLFDLIDHAKLSVINLTDFPSWDLSELATVVNLAPDLDLMAQLHLAESLMPERHPRIEAWLEPSGASFVLPWDEWETATVRLNPILSNSPRFIDLWQKAQQHQAALSFTWAGDREITIPAAILQTMANLLTGPQAVPAGLSSLVQHLDDQLVLQRLS